MTIYHKKDFGVVGGGGGWVRGGGMRGVDITFIIDDIMVHTTITR